ncbi:winged helix-turn-helix transcriptional regulator [Sphingobium boeckii]|uniref:DNA-binding HxlR family transcriptional regulator n=1 Tax=Sphingobium boeckii TaxID=1082345 RepID=A0A7W9AF32_9SPHN|nr:winged helix-turn-helix transcriptional regulator [Sphingobium boeckii]MBB5684488.1 DNA-binding HxlR family transcriptional regulator [Sphingobium boeckii]
MELVGERWSLLIVRELLLGPRRFGELRDGLPGISANVLTQRLESLAAAGIVTRHKLPAPASAQVYALTPWGRECEPIVLGIGRWALRSPTHDPTLNFSPVSLMLSLKMLFVASRAGDFSAVVGFVFDAESYVAKVSGGVITVARGDVAGSAAIFTSAPGALLPLFYGGMPLSQAEASGGILVSGDRAAAARFAGLFALPAKIANGE